MSHLTSNAIDTITKPIKYVNCFFSVTHFGLGHEGGVDIPKLKHWVLTPKSDKMRQTFSIMQRSIHNDCFYLIRQKSDKVTVKGVICRFLQCAICRR